MRRDTAECQVQSLKFLTCHHVREKIRDFQEEKYVIKQQITSIDVHINCSLYNKLLKVLCLILSSRLKLNTEEFQTNNR